MSQGDTTTDAGTGRHRRFRFVVLTVVALVTFGVVFGLRVTTSKDLTSGLVTVSVGGAQRNTFFNGNAVEDLRETLRVREILERVSARTEVPIPDLRAGLSSARLGSASRLINITYRNADAASVTGVLDAVVDEVDLWLRRRYAAEADVTLVPDLASAGARLDAMRDITVESGMSSLPDSRQLLSTEVRLLTAQVARVEPGDPGLPALRQELKEKEDALDDLGEFAGSYRQEADAYAGAQLPLIRAENARAEFGAPLSIASPLGPPHRTGRINPLIDDLRAGMSGAGIAVLVELALFWLIDRGRRDPVALELAA